MAGTLYLPINVPFFEDPKTQQMAILWIRFLQEVQTGLSSVPWASIDFTGSSLADIVTRSAADLSTGTLPLGRLSGITTTQLAAAAGITIGQIAPSSAEGSTYTPALTNTTNIAASTAYSIQYMRVGNTVTVGGQVDIDPTAAGACSLGISLPWASALSASNQLGGTAWAPVPGYGGSISADAANDRAQLDFTAAADVANRSWFFSFTYRVQ